METLQKTTYRVSGMTCEACQYKVQTLLGKVPGVQHVEVDLKTGETSVESEQKVALSVLQNALKSTSYRIERDFPLTAPVPIAAHTPHEPEALNQSFFEEEAPKSWLETYKPLLLITAFITGVAGLTAFPGQVFTTENFNLVNFLHNFMTGFFLVFSFFKLLNLKEFASSFAMYDLAAMKIPAYGFVYPFLELALGVACLVHFQDRAVYVADIALMGFGALGVAKSVLNKRKIRCACLGAVFNLPMSTVTLIENTLMVAVGVALLALTS
ncbi:MAG: cation transporter [Cytophagaceae bacterium]|nr:cation transporter [Cytophagaceae bacterium]